MKEYISGMTQKQLETYGKDNAEEESEIRFMIEADPFYLIFYTKRKGPSPDKEYWRLATVYKDPKEGYKITNVNTQNDLTRMLFQTDLTKKILKPMAMTQFKNLNKK